MRELKYGVYPGTFDPITNGHMDIINRATQVVDELIVGVAVNAGKTPMFSSEERLAMVVNEISSLDKETASRIKAILFDNLLVDFVEQQNASIIIRGLRAVSDFEYEFQMAAMNSRLNKNLETIFLMASDNNQFISSRFVKEIGLLGGDVGQFVPKSVRDQLTKQYSKRI